ncbi:MAG: hypothetical protein WCQ21_38680, partial [Verrucomicrobiota bacterium]
APWAPSWCLQQQHLLIHLWHVAPYKKPWADTGTLEREIDQQVCALYGLTPEEIQLVEGVR